MIILGTKFYSHDSAFCRLDTENQDILAISTERATRFKHDDAPVTLLFDQLPAGEIDVVAHSFQNFADEETCVENISDYPWSVFAFYIGRILRRDQNDAKVKENQPLYEFAQRIMQIRQQETAKGIPPEVVAHACAMATIGKLLEGSPVKDKTKIEFFNHHLCHAMSAYYPSPFYGHSALVLTLDGWGDGYSGKAYIFRGEHYQEIGASPISSYDYAGTKRPLSLGVLYQTFTAAAGFRESSEEGKVEALAAFGKPIPEIYDELMQGCVIDNNGIYLSSNIGNRYYRKEFLRHLCEEHGLKNFCATIQKFLEDAVVTYINSLSLPPDIDCLCLAGGVAANIIMNLAIYERTRFKKIHVAPYMGDEGTAVGAAILAARLHGVNLDWLPSKIMPYFGPSYSRTQVRAILEKRGGAIRFTDLGDSWPEQAGKAIAEGKIISIFQGKMEFGPRALGNRSILANPADPTIRERINVSIKRRPPWQPFCPSILESERERLFIDSFSHKHMAIAFRMKPEFALALPSAVHIDGTARPQFVSPEDNPTYYRLLQEVKNRTGFGVVINTSFNLHGRAMVMTPDHAIDDFLDCNLEALYIEGFCVMRLASASS